MRVIPGRGCVCGVVGRSIQDLPVLATVRNDGGSRTVLKGRA